MKKPARYEPRGKILQVHIVGRTLQISDTVHPPERISLDDLGSAALISISDFNSAVDLLLPHNSGISTANFPLESVTDSYERGAVHRQKTNASWMDPMRQGIVEALTAPGEKNHHLRSPRGPLRRNNVEQWLHLEQRALGLLSTVLSLANALILPEGSFKYFRFDATDTDDRNIWVTPNWIVFLVNPKTDLHRRPSKADIYVFPPDSTKAVLLLLYIIRPIACHFLSLTNKEVPEYNSIIWAHAFRRPTAFHKFEWRWSGPNISLPLRRITFKTTGVALTPSLLRAIGRAVIPVEFPQLFADIFPSFVDIQAQHQSSTRLNHYGSLLNFPRLKNISPEHPVRAVAISQIWQAALGIGPMNEAWEALAVDSCLFPTRHTDVAFEEARRMVYKSYCIGSFGTPQERRNIIASLLKDQPFLHGPNVSAKIHQLLVSSLTQRGKREWENRSQ